MSTDRDRIELWDVATGERRVTLIESAPFHPAAKGVANDHPNPVDQAWLRDCQLVFSPDSRTIAAFPVRHERADMPGLVVDESFIVWDVATGRRLWERKAAPGKGVFPIFTPNPRVLVEEDQNTGRIQLIKAQDGSVQETISIAPGIDFKHEVGSPEAPVFTPDGRLIAIRRRVPDRPPGLEKWLGDWWPWRRFTNSAVAIIVELATGREVFRGERPNLTDVLVSEDGRTALTLELEADSQATIIRCWDIPSPSRLPWSIGVPVVIASVIVVVKRVLWAKSD